MTVKLVASDLDGTFLAKDNSIPESNLKAIETMKQKNIPFAICTGKSYVVSKDICNAEYGIFGNGTQVVDFKNNKEIFHIYLKNSDIDFCYKLAKNYGLHIHAYGDNFIITEKLDYLALNNYVSSFHKIGSTFGKYDTDFNLTLTSSKDNNFTFYIVQNFVKYIEQNNLNVFNIILSSEGSLNKVVKNLDEYKDSLSFQYCNKKKEYKDSIINKEYEYISIAPKDAKKGIALNFLKKYLDVNTNDILSIGDNLNDIDLLENSGVGVAISNAYDAVKKVATYTTCSSASDGGFAEAIYKFIN